MEIQTTPLKSFMPQCSPPLSGNIGDWYALATIPGSEEQIRSSIHNITGGIVTPFVPQRKICHRLKGKLFEVIRPLIPGYLFIHNELNPLFLRNRYTAVKNNILPTTALQNPLSVPPEEMTFILKLTASEGVADLSLATWAPETPLFFLAGPLKHCHDHIVRTNLRKRKAWVETKFLRRRYEICLGFQLQK
ncbi:MAG: hypothetical protein MI747_11000 [Desulfobacterales bacterium]|nr:hypothetical protein [Desulfobacterales bacterium]